MNLRLELKELSLLNSTFNLQKLAKKKIKDNQYSVDLSELSVTYDISRKVLGWESSGTENRGYKKKTIRTGEHQS